MILLDMTPGAIWARSASNGSATANGETLAPEVSAESSTRRGWNSPYRPAPEDREKISTFRYTSRRLELIGSREPFSQKERPRPFAVCSRSRFTWTQERQTRYHGIQLRGSSDDATASARHMVQRHVPFASAPAGTGTICRRQRPLLPGLAEL